MSEKMTNPPKVSVILPVYNMAGYLEEAVQGILNQTYQNFELIVVNDASTDHTDQIMHQFDDPRIKYLVHSENRYAAAARNTAIRASEGELIAFIDADDKVHPEKLGTQVTFLEENPEISLSYCSRIEIDQNGSPLTLVPALPIVTLQDLVLGYPYAPSEVVMRREWITKVGLFDETFRFSGEDPDFHMRLALRGCRMAGVRRVLNHRRLHSGRIRKNLNSIVADGIQAFENTFSNPLCPAEVIELRDQTMSMLYRIFSFIAFSQGDTSLGQQLIRKAIEFDKPFFTGDLMNYVDFLIRSSIRSGGNHEELLKDVIRQLPPELEGMNRFTDFAIGYGYLLRYVRDFLWGRVDSGRQSFERARFHGVKPDNYFLQFVATHLSNHEEEFGQDAAQDLMELLVSHLIGAGNSTIARKLKSRYMMSRAFREYRSGDHASVVATALGAIGSDPSYLVNRGVLAMLFHSTFGRLRIVPLSENTR